MKTRTTSPGVVMVVVVLLLLINSVSTASSSSMTASIKPWDLPLVPPSSKWQELEKRFADTLPKSHSYFDKAYKKKIPRSVWIAFAEKPTNATMKPHIQKMITKNEAKQWVFHLQGNAEKLEFMETFFANTSTLWAYKAIHPRVGNSAADIWRYAVLWMFGGLYLDDDSYLEATYDEIFNSEETLVVSTEKNAYKDECYHSKFHLSATTMANRYPSSMPPGHVHQGRVIVSWAIFSAPRHPMVHRTLENIVEIIKYEYLRQSVLSLPRGSAKWMFCMCTTGPTVFTTSQREMILHYGPEVMNDLITVHKRDFHNFGGVFKIFEPDRSIDNHYMHTMQAFDIPLLHSYIDTEGKDVNGKSPTTTASSMTPTIHDISHYNGKVISSDGKEIFYVMNNTRYGFSDWDAYVTLRMQHHRLHRIPLEELNRIPMATGKHKLLTSDDNEFVKDYQMKIHIANQEREGVSNGHGHSIHGHNWTISWPNLADSFLSHLEGKTKTFNVTQLPSSAIGAVGSSSGHHGHGHHNGTHSNSVRKLMV